MQTILITGGTGLIGKELRSFLVQSGYSVVILSRDPARYKREISTQVRFASWDPAKGSIEPSAIKEADHIINLAGAGVADKRWTAARKREIVESRVSSGQLICKSLLDIPNNVQSVVSASAIGWYGPDPRIPNDFPFTEADHSSGDYLGDTCRKWENSILPVQEMGKRLVILRTGIVLSREGGALAEFAKPVRFGIAPILGSGTQVISWIHVRDLVRMYVAAIQKSHFEGVYNAVAPEPVNNKKMMLTIAREVKGKAFIPVHVPAFVIRLMLGEMSVEVLKSTTVSSAKLSKQGFQFAFPGIDTAIADLCRKM